MQQVYGRPGAALKLFMNKFKAKEMLKKVLVFASFISRFTPRDRNASGVRIH
jgi:hypothetical protein